MNYLIYQGDKLTQKAATQEEGMQKLERLAQEWKEQTGRLPWTLVLGYNGFKWHEIARIERTA